MHVALGVWFVIPPVPKSIGFWSVADDSADDVVAAKLCWVLRVVKIGIIVPMQDLWWVRNRHGSILIEQWLGPELCSGQVAVLVILMR